MAILKIYEVEEKQVNVGGQPKNLKECVIQEEGKQFPYKKVTVWQDYPEYAGIQAGATIDHSYVDIKPQKPKADNSHINPKSGKPYNQYTLMYGQNSPSNAQNSPQSQGRAKLESIYVMQQRLEAKVDILLNHFDVNQTTKAEEDDVNDEISPEDIPFS